MGWWRHDQRQLRWSVQQLLRPLFAGRPFPIQPASSRVIRLTQDCETLPLCIVQQAESTRKPNPDGPWTSGPAIAQVTMLHCNPGRCRLWGCTSATTEPNSNVLLPARMQRAGTVSHSALCDVERQHCSFHSILLFHSSPSSRRRARGCLS
jgi:hypothetical protein